MRNVFNDFFNLVLVFKDIELRYERTGTRFLINVNCKWCLRIRPD